MIYYILKIICNEKVTIISFILYLFHLLIKFLILFVMLWEKNILKLMERIGVLQIKILVDYLI